MHYVLCEILTMCIFFIECLTNDNLQYCHSVLQITFHIT